MKKRIIYGMPVRDWRKVGKLLNAEKVTEKNIPTVSEYLAEYEVKTETRISKKGVKLIKVFYPSGAVKEYEQCRIDTAAAFDI